MNSPKNILLQDERVQQSYYADNSIIDKISQWISMYENSAEDEDTLGLPAAICNEIARLVTLELEFEVVDVNKTVTDDTNAVETRAQYINRSMKPIVENIKKYTEYACAGGGLVFKPIINGDKITIDVNFANHFVPLSFDDNVMTAIMFLDIKTRGNKHYFRFECHEFKDKTYKVSNKAYVSSIKDAIGRPCSLTEVDEWANLSEEQIIENVPLPLFEYFKIPDGNCLDMTSPLGVSVFYRSIPQIKKADAQWDRYNWEFESGERIMEASKDAFETDKDGAPVIPKGQDRLFWITELDGNDTNKLVNFHSPEFREVAQKAGLNTILQRIEFNCGLAYGTLSDPTDIQKTSTEIKASKQRSYSTVTGIQKALDKSLKNVAKIIDVYCDLYHNLYQQQPNNQFILPEKSEYAVNASWDDSIVIDSDTERTRDMNEVRQGLMAKWEYRVKWYGEDEETAKSKIAEMDKKANANDPFDFNKTE